MTAAQINMAHFNLNTINTKDGKKEGGIGGRERERGGRERGRERRILISVMKRESYKERIFC